MTSEPKWTKGPWAVGALDRHGQRIVYSQHIEICTCWHHSVGAIEKEMEANARLIAAAPEMAEALEALLNCPDIADSDYKDEETHAAERKARAALAKARGELPPPATPGRGE